MVKGGGLDVEELLMMEWMRVVLWVGMGETQRGCRLRKRTGLEREGGR